MLKLHGKYLENLAQTANSTDGEPVAIGCVSSYSHQRIVITGLSACIGTILSIETDGGPASAEVTSADKSHLVAMSLGNTALKVGAKVRVASANSAVDVGPELLGRIIDSLGKPLDHLGALVTQECFPLDGRSDNVLNRGRVVKQINTGIRAINALLPIGYGQRTALVAGSGVGKSVLLQQIVAGTDVDVIIVGLIGERAREISDFVAEAKAQGALHKMVIIAVPADHSPLLRIKAVKRACAIAEHFRDTGKNVLLVIDSLTRVAHAQREIGLSNGEPPTMKGYPPSAIALIPQIIERAGNDERNGGSITSFYTILADGDDMDDPIVDAARAIADGHIILSRALAEQGVFPAIDISRSISRTAYDFITQKHHAALKDFLSLWSTYTENQDLLMMGAYQVGADPKMDMAVAAHDNQIEFIVQDRRKRIDISTAVKQLCESYVS